MILKIKNPLFFFPAKVKIKQGCLENPFIFAQQTKFGTEMKFLLVLLPLLASSLVYAQKDIDVVYLKNGTRIACEIQKVKNDSIFITQFSRHHRKTSSYALDETAVYLVNNFYTTPGEEFIKASRNLKFGVGISLVGGALAFLGRKDDRDNLVDIGAGVAGLGAIVCILAFDNFKKAGKKMNRIDYQGDRLIYKL